MQSSQQNRYVINNSRVLHASNTKFNTEMEPSVPLQTNPTNNRSAYLKQDDYRSSMASQRPPQGRQSEYPVKSIVIQGIAQKRKVLQKYRYINQLARMEYEDKEEEVYSRYTRVSKATVQKKIMARNQIAQFEDQDQEQNQWFDQLMEFKFGKQKNAPFYYQKQS